MSHQWRESSVVQISKKHPFDWRRAGEFCKKGLLYYTAIFYISLADLRLLAYNLSHFSKLISSYQNLLTHLVGSSLTSM